MMASDLQHVFIAYIVMHIQFKNGLLYFLMLFLFHFLLVFIGLGTALCSVLAVLKCYMNKVYDDESASQIERTIESKNIQYNKYT